MVAVAGLFPATAVPRHFLQLFLVVPEFLFIFCLECLDRNRVKHCFKFGKVVNVLSYFQIGTTRQWFVEDFLSQLGLSSYRPSRTKTKL
jgi:hypothetical protein